MKNKKLIDIETGEIVYGLVEIKKKYITGGFFMAMQEGFIHIAKLGLTGEQLSVLMLIFGKLDFENWIRLSQKDIAEQLDIAQPHVSRSLKVLVEKRIIHKGPKVGTSSTYRLDPLFGLKGKSRNAPTIRKDIAKLAKEKGMSLVISHANGKQVELWSK